MKALAALLAMGMAVPATAGEEGDAGKPAKPRLVCKRDYSSTSRLGAGPKVCRAAGEKRGKAAREVRSETAAVPAPLSAPAVTQARPVQVASAAEVTVTPPRKEKKICKRQESSVSRLGAGPRICKTAAEWRGMPVLDDREKLQMNEAKGR